MKNQYFGDVNDFRKYGLLRALQAPGNLSLVVGWMLTPDDGSSDGKLRRYLHEPNRWQQYDQPLFGHLSAALSDEATPSVALLERSSILPRAQFFSEIVPDGRAARALWGARLLVFAAGADLVFLDPDNGFEIPSMPIGSRDSSKHVAWCEVERLWGAGSSVLVYQHYNRRERRDVFASRLAAELQCRTESPFVEAFSTPLVLFLLAAQPRHSVVFEEAIACHLPQWGGQIAVAGLADNGIQTDNASALLPKRKNTPRVAEMLAEYDFSGGERGRYAKRFAEGTNIIVLDPDVAVLFPDSRSVNEALRALSKIADRQRKLAPRSK